MYPNYQCFKTLARDVYCSAVKYDSHAEGKAWVTRAMAHFNIQGNQLKEKPYTRNNQPEGAIIYA